MISLATTPPELINAYRATAEANKARNKERLDKANANFTIEAPPKQKKTKKGSIEAKAIRSLF